MPNSNILIGYVLSIEYSYTGPGGAASKSLLDTDCSAHPHSSNI